MNPQSENQPNPIRNPETRAVDTILVEFTDEPGGAPLDSPEVVERNRRRLEQLRENEPESPDSEEE